MTNRRGQSKSNWVGIILIIFGLLLLVDNLDLLYYITPDYYYPPIHLFSWPMILLVIGAIILANDSRSTMGWIFLGIGGLNIAARFLHFSVGGLISDFWPLILIGIGAFFIFKKRDRKTIHFYTHHDNTSNEFHSEIKNGINEMKQEFKKEFGEEGEKIKEEFKSAGQEFKNEFNKDYNSDYNKEQNSADMIDEVSVFNSIKRRITSQNFRGGRITSIFGGADIFMNEAKLAQGEQVLDIVAIFGGIDLYVPRDWRVIVKTVTIFGGFDDNRFRDSGVEIADDRAIVIKGFVLFGGGDVKN